MASFNSPQMSEAMPVIVDSRPPPMSQAILDKIARKYTPGSLITFNAKTKQSQETFVVYARVVEEVGDSLHIVICNEQNKNCTDFSNGIQAGILPKRNVLCLKRTMYACGDPITLEGMASCAAGGANKKSRRHKQRKPSKTKRKTRRAKRTRKRRA
jgi:hypothetical protein